MNIELFGLTRFMPHIPPLATMQTAAHPHPFGLSLSKPGHLGKHPMDSLRANRQSKASKYSSIFGL